MYAHPLRSNPRRTTGRLPEGKALSRPQLNLLNKQLEEERLRWKREHGESELRCLFRMMTEDEFNIYLRFGGIPDRLQ